MNNKGNWAKPLLAMVEASHSRNVMEQVCDFDPDESAFVALEEMCRGMLQTCRPEGSSCVIMSSLLAQCLSDELDTTIPVVAGALKVGGSYMYGSNSAFDGKLIFSESTDDWDGHCWVLFGPYIVDISLGRTARRGECRAPLTRAVINTFGDKVGMIAVTEKGAREAGLVYLPRYVMTPEQVLALAGGAIEKFDL